jgi:FdhD protein
MQRDSSTPVTCSGLTKEYDVVTVSETDIGTGHVEVCVEDTVTLLLDDIRIANLTVTPAELEAFALGYVVCEGLVPGLSAVESITVDGLTVNVRTNMSHEREMPRETEIRSSGGIGVKTPWYELTEAVQGDILLNLDAIFDGMDTLHRMASTWRNTGGTHCSVILDADGAMQSHAEDMGRHTAVDKAVGKALSAGIDLSGCFMACTGRMPAGMVAKAYRAGVPVIVTNNAPFSTGIDLARRLDMTLVGFARRPRAVVYSAPHRIRDL